jgi:hypothetical protein
MDAITNAINAHVENEVAALKVSLAKARSAAVMWRKRAEKAELDAFEEECDVALDADEIAHRIKNLKAQNTALRARAMNAETALTEALKKLDAAYQRGVDDGLDLAKVAADAEKMPKAVEGEGCSSKPTVTVFEGIRYPTVSTAGAEICKLKDLTYEEALAKAVELKCNVMVKRKNGNTWYLKGKNMDFATLKKNIEFLSTSKPPRSLTRIIYLIEH